LFEVSPTDPLTLAAVSALVLGVTLAASYVPARRASKVDPMTALRCE
jgi:putative ABC transport system permease protein